MSLAQYFVGGYWKSVTTSPQATETTFFQFNPDGTYQEKDRYVAPQGHVSVMIYGQWSVRPAGGANVVLSVTPQRANPPQICGTNGCRQIPLVPAQYPMTLLERNAVSVNGNRVERVPSMN